MTPEQIQQIIDTIMTVGGSVAQSGFRLALARAIAEGVSAAVWATLLTGVALACLKAARYGVAQVEETNDEWPIPLAMFGGFGAILFGLLAALNLNNAILILISPEWHAIEILLGLVK